MGAANSSVILTPVSAREVAVLPPGLPKSRPVITGQIRLAPLLRGVGGRAWDTAQKGIDVMESASNRQTGAIIGNGATHWRVWCPTSGSVDLVLWQAGERRVLPMHSEQGGFFSRKEAGTEEGLKYTFRLNGGEDRSDPCSLWQPEGVTGPSATVNTAGFQWTDQNWKGTPREQLVFYELHIGTFTPQGTFDAVIPRLDSLRELGVTAIEIMPVGQFPGSRNWGYDGVLPYAAQNTYGGPHGLQRLVDACHSRGLAIFLDIVYNHFGPEANYLREFGPYFTHKYNTPWGDAINYDDKGSDAVRDFVIDNARMWLSEFHFDGLRLDAVHAIYDLGARHILKEISEVAGEIAQVRSGDRDYRRE